MSASTKINNNNKTLLQQTNFFQTYLKYVQKDAPTHLIYRFMKEKHNKKLHQTLKGFRKTTN